jgi:hypothetical protein
MKIPAADAAGIFYGRTICAVADLVKAGPGQYNTCG